MNNPKEKCWVLKNNEKVMEFCDFAEAKKAFRISIRNALNDEDAYTDGVPFSLGAYFSGKYDDRSISDQEIVIDKRIEFILDLISSPYPIDYVDDMLLKKLDLLLPTSYFYSGTNQFDEEVEISIDKNNDDIDLRIDVDDNIENNMLYTNAFVLENEDKLYYFESKETISTSNSRDKLGKTLYSYITLEKKHMHSLTKANDASNKTK